MPRYMRFNNNNKEGGLWTQLPRRWELPCPFARVPGVCLGGVWLVHECSRNQQCCNVVSKDKSIPANLGSEVARKILWDTLCPQLVTVLQV